MLLNLRHPLLIFLYLRNMLPRTTTFMIKNKIAPARYATKCATLPRSVMVSLNQSAPRFRKKSFFDSGSTTVTILIR